MEVAASASGSLPGAAVVVLTHNRVHLLRRCVENVLFRTSTLTREIVIWNNGSTDGTREYLDSLGEPRLQVVHHPENLAMNALPRAIELTTAAYLIELDDDMVEAPPGWDETLLEAFMRVPRIGFLQASLAFDPDDAASQYLKYMRDERKAYIPREVNGVRLLEGSVGGGCTITSRELYERVGGFKEHKKFPYWRPDIPYQRAIRRLGYFSAFLVDLELRHAGGAPHSKPPQAKLDWHSHEAKVRARKDRIKRTILRIPFATTLNERYRWFDPPAPLYIPPARVMKPSEPSEAS